MKIVADYIYGDERATTVVGEVNAILKLAGATGAFLGLIGYSELSSHLKAAGAARSILSGLAIIQATNLMIRGELTEKGAYKENALKLSAVPLHFGRFTKFALQWIDSADTRLLRELCAQAVPTIALSRMAGPRVMHFFSRGKSKGGGEPGPLITLKDIREGLTLALFPFVVGWIAPDYTQVAKALGGITALMSLYEKKVWFDKTPDA